MRWALVGLALALVSLGASAQTASDALDVSVEVDLVMDQLISIAQVGVAVLSCSVMWRCFRWAQRAI